MTLLKTIYNKNTMANKKKTTNPNGLTEFEERFIATWFNMSFNGRLAYLSLRPDVKPHTADTEASKILNNPKVQVYIDLKREHIRIKENIDLAFLVENLKAVILDIRQEQIERDANGRITNKPDRANLIKAVDGLAKLAGYYNIKQDHSGIDENPNEITININKTKE